MTQTRKRQLGSRFSLFLLCQFYEVHVAACCELGYFRVGVDACVLWANRPGRRPVRLFPGNPAAGCILPQAERSPELQGSGSKGDKNLPLLPCSQPSVHQPARFAERLLA